MATSYDMILDSLIGLGGEDDPFCYCSSVLCAMAQQILVPVLQRTLAEYLEVTDHTVDLRRGEIALAQVALRKQHVADGLEISGQVRYGSRKSQAVVIVFLQMPCLLPSSCFFWPEVPGGSHFCPVVLVGAVDTADPD